MCYTLVLTMDPIWRSLPDDLVNKVLCKVDGIPLAVRESIRNGEFYWNKLKYDEDISYIVRRYVVNTLQRECVGDAWLSMDNSERRVFYEEYSCAKILTNVRRRLEF